MSQPGQNGPLAVVESLRGIELCFKTESVSPWLESVPALRTTVQVIANFIEYCDCVFYIILSVSWLRDIWVVKLVRVSPDSSSPALCWLWTASCQQVSCFSFARLFNIVSTIYPAFQPTQTQMIRSKTVVSYPTNGGNVISLENGNRLFSLIFHSIPTLCSLCKSCPEPAKLVEVKTCSNDCKGTPSVQGWLSLLGAL